MTTHIKWAGSQESFREVEAYVRAVATATTEQLKLASDWEDEQDDMEDEHELLEMHNSVAIITIRGAMIDGSAGWWGRYYDIVGYDDIRNAVATAVNNKAKQILIHIMSPGGQVLGIGALSEFLKEAGVKAPITFFAESYAASGGVWLATSTGAFYASKHAEVGSVGVIAVASEYTEMDKMLGVTRRVFKSTPLKSSGNPNEKLDEANAAEIQRGIDESNTRFVSHIATSMGLSNAFVSDNIATGQVWYAEEAMRLGLVTGITTFDELLVDLEQKVTQNSNNARQEQPLYVQQNSEADMAKRKTIKADSPEEALAMAASGIPVRTASDSVDDEVDPPAEEQNEDEDENVVEKSGEQTETTAEAPEAASVSSFNKMLSDSMDKLVTTKVELATVKAELAVTAEKVSSLQATETLLKNIVARAIRHATVAAGASAPPMESLLAMDSHSLIAQDTAAQTALEKRFGGGGQVSVIVDDEVDEETKKAEAAAKFSEEISTDLARIFK